MIKITRPPCPHPHALESNNYKHPRNKEALKAASYDKCMYCESKISHIDFAHIEHIKPKAVGKYPELEFDWNNLGYACPKCNNEKSDKFYEDTPFIDPYSSDPSHHFFAFGSMLFSKNGCERAEISIKEIALNRPELLEKRQQRIDDISKAINACNRITSVELKRIAISELKKESEEDKEYSIFVKSFFHTCELE